MPENECLANKWQRWTERNPCGHLTIAPPLVNITGYIAAGQKLPPSVDLYITPNVTEDAARYVMHHCRPLTRVRPTDGRHVVFENIPPGTFIIATPNPTRAFRVETIGVSSDGVIRSNIQWVETSDGWKFVTLNISRD